jgi:PEP-CTERM/exosortase A-associated glycosyltransferase
MRILHVLDHSLPLHSGYTFRTLAILREQRALGWETVHLTSPKHTGACAAEEEVDGWRFYRTLAKASWQSSVPGLRELGIMKATARRIEEAAAQCRPDVIHAHSPVLNALPALRVGERLGIPVVYEVRAFWEDAAVDHGTSREWGLRYRLTRSLETSAVQRAAHVTTICEGLRAELVARGLPEDKITVIPNAVDVEGFKFGEPPDEALRRSLGLDQAKAIGFIGSFYAYEGLDLLIEALPAVLREIAEARVLLVGGGPEEGKLKALARRLGLEHAVRFAGRVPHAEVQRYYSIVDVLAYPRRAIRLTDLVTPLKPLEAMAQGLVVVASDVGGHRELIRDGVNGALFRAGSAEALAQALVAIFRGRPPATELKRNGRAFVERERTWRNSVARYEPIYRRLGSRVSA